MIRKLALVTTVLAAALGARSAAAQSTAPTQKPTAAPAAKPAPAMTVKMDSGTKSTAKQASAKPASTATRHAAWTKTDVKEVQEGLAKAGLYKGKVTGELNSETRKAIREYQKEKKLPVTGRLSADLLTRLKSA